MQNNRVFLLMLAASLCVAMAPDTAHAFGAGRVIRKIFPPYGKKKPNPTPTPAPTSTGPACNQVPDGAFQACYFNGTDFASLAHVTQEGSISHNWGLDAPATGVQADQFSVRFSGNFDFEEGTYRFQAKVDDGVRVWIDGELLIDQWRDQGVTTFTASRPMTAGKHKVVLEYYENEVAAFVTFEWSKGGAQAQRRTGRVRASGRALVDDQGEFNALGATMMWALWGYKYDRAKLERNLEVLARNGVDYIRALGVISRQPARPGDYWYERDMNSSWPDYDEMIAGLTDLAYDQYGIRVEWTIFGGAGDFNEGQKQQLIDRFLNMSRGREHKIIHFEVANEYEGTGWSGDDSIRNMTRYLNDRTDILVAASSAYQETDDLCAEFSALYRGGIADIGTWHFDRDVRLGDGPWRPVRQPWEYPYCPEMPVIGSNNEPIGPGASVASETDPMRLVTAALVTYVSGLPLYVYHSEAGIRGNVEFLSYETPATEAFARMKDYVPRNLTNWTRHNHHWAGHPFNIDGNVMGYPAATGNGAVRAYGATSGGEFFIVPIGIRDYFDMQAKNAMELDVIHPITGEVLEHRVLQAGETLRLRGLSAYVVKGRHR